MSSSESRIDRIALAAALVYAVCVSPFIGGVRGPMTTFGWIAIPLAWAAARRRWCDVGLGASRRRNATAAAVGAAAGLATGLLLLAVNRAVPEFLQFVWALPALHREMVFGNIVLFLLGIPLAHFIHELFYRGFLQTHLARAFASPVLAILLCALLYAWTHVFIFASDEYRAAVAAVVGATGVPLAGALTTLQAVVIFSFVESILGGAAFHLTGSLWSTVALRATNLSIIVAVLYPRAAIL